MGKLERENGGGFRGRESKEQIRFLDQLGTDAITSGVLGPGRVITSDISAGPVLVNKGAILRIQASADTYIAFGASNLAAVDANTSPAFKHPGSYVLLVATDNYIRGSAAVTRLEVMIEGKYDKDSE